jgi:TetR/AcrR family transcriptional regulator, fatty acid metabolism regulator protein
MAKAEGSLQKKAKRTVNRLPATRRIEDIMNAARVVFAERGYDDASITDIAAKAGVVEGSIYRFFDSKRHLLIKVVENWYDEMLQVDAAQLSGIRGTWNRIRFIVHHHLASIKREPALSRLVLQELRLDPEYRSSRLHHLNQSYAHRINDVVKEAMDAGEFRADVSPSFVRDLVFGCIEHRTWAFLRSEGDFDVEETASTLTDIVCRGLATDRGPAVATGAGDMQQVVAKLESLVARLEKQVR